MLPVYGSGLRPVHCTAPVVHYPFMFQPRFLFSFFAAAALVVACAPEGEQDDPSAAGDATEPTEATEQDVTAGAGRRVCSWNLRRLGNQFDQRPKDMKSAAKIVKDNCDLIAIEEDMATANAGNAGYDDLLKALGSRYWGGLATSKPAPFPQTSNSEHYAFFFRKSAVSICEGFGTEAMRLPDPEDIYLREPAFGCFKFKSSEHELVLAGYHAIFGEPAERKREVGFLDDDNDNDGTKDDLFNLMKASRPGTEPDVVLVGDFNLNANDLKDVLPRYVDHTIGNGSTLNDQDGISGNQYDHVVVMADARMITAGTKPAEVLDVRAQHEPGVSFYRSVSDHLPIRFTMK